MTPYEDAISPILVSYPTPPPENRGIRRFAVEQPGPRARATGPVVIHSKELAAEISAC